MTKSKTIFDGFYASYLTGTLGSSFGMFTFKDGTIAGADTGGGKYDGVYEIGEQDNKCYCKIDFVLPLGGQSITGASAKDEPIRITVPVIFPGEIRSDEVFRVETIIGPVNVRLEKIRGF